MDQTFSMEARPVVVAGTALPDDPGSSSCAPITAAVIAAEKPGASDAPLGVPVGTPLMQPPGGNPTRLRGRCTLSIGPEPPELAVGMGEMGARAATAAATDTMEETRTMAEGVAVGEILPQGL